MYEFIKTFHSHFKYIVFLGLAVFLIWNIVQMAKKSQYGKKDLALLKIIVVIFDLQVLMGLLLYFFYSPLGIAAFSKHGSAVMKTAELRYFAVEHIFAMIVSLFLIHFTSIRVKKMLKNNHNSASIFKFQLIALLSTIVLILLRTPL